VNADQQTDAMLDRAASPLLLLMLVAFVVIGGLGIAGALL
jgi:hypothetical protein